MSCMSCDDKMVVGTHVTLRNPDMHVIESHEDLSLQFGSTPTFELILGQPIVDMLIPVLTSAQERFRRAEEAAELELQDA